MSKYRFFTIDTNFFISGYGEVPASYERLNQIFLRMKIKIIIPDYVQKEMRWYMRRSIEPFLTVRTINAGKLKKFEDISRKKVSIGLPQLADMAVILLASQENIPIVSSDLRLVEVAQELGLTAFMNSAFLVMLLEEVVDEEDEKYLQSLYDKIIAEEITHSVKSQGKYDPVIRIQKIVDSALSALKLQSQIEGRKEKKIKKNYDFPAYHELADVTKKIRTDISDYIDILETGNYQRLKFELKEAINKLSDLLIEMQLAKVTSDDDIIEEALTTLGHILLLSSTVALGEQRLADASAIIDQLSIISSQNKQLEERLDIEIHLQRMTIFFLTEQFPRFNIYFTPNFNELCKKRGREDILTLHRTMAIIIAALTTKEAEKTATAKDFSEIQYIIQLGVQFIAMKKVDNAWLLLEQAVYMSINSKMTGLLFAVFEVLQPLSFITGIQLSPSFDEILNYAKRKEKSLPFDDFTRRSVRHTKLDEKLLRKRAISPSKLPSQFKGFFDVISSKIVDFKNIGRCTFVRVIDWNTMHFIGIVDPSQSLDINLTVGSSIKILDGTMRITPASAGIKEKRNVDLLIICKPDKLRFVIRRAGQVQVAQSRISEYDL